MGQLIVRRARADVTDLNARRRDIGQPPYPNVSCFWVVHPFKIERKMHKSLIRRNFTLLEDLLAGDHFPSRPGYLVSARNFHPNGV